MVGNQLDDEPNLYIGNGWLEITIAIHPFKTTGGLRVLDFQVKHRWHQLFRGNWMADFRGFQLMEINSSLAVFQEDIIKLDLPSGKLTWLAGKWTWIEDVFPIETGDFPLLCQITGVYPPTKDKQQENGLWK